MNGKLTSYHDHQCLTCGRLFPQEGNLLLHIDRMHSGTRAFPCTQSECHKTFPSAELLRKHIRNTHQSVRLKCSTCNMVYSTSSALRRHERIHSNTRRYVCSRCGAGFDLSEPYKIHLRQHDGIQPYSCSICSKRFTSRAVCRRHRMSNHKS